MRDPRDDLLPLTHPNGPHRMEDVPAPCDPPRWPEEYATVTPAATAPKPPPDGMPVDPAKWAALTRAERRALLRHHRKVTGER